MDPNFSDNQGLGSESKLPQDRSEILFDLSNEEEFQPDITIQKISLIQRLRAYFKNQNEITRVINSKQAILIRENKLNLIRKFLYFITGSNLYYQIRSFGRFLNPDTPEIQFVQITNWVLWIGMFGCAIISKTKNRIKFVLPGIVCASIRNLLPMLDIDQKTKSMTQEEIHSYMILQVVGVLLLQLNINFVANKKISFPTSFLTCFITFLGQEIMPYNNQDATIYEIFIEAEKWKSFIQNFINGSIGLLYFQYLLDFGQHEILKAWNTRDATQKELISILQNLQEAIITRNKNGFAFVNRQGSNILAQISGNPNLKQVDCSCSFEPATSLQQSEKFIMNNEVFQLYEDTSKVTQTNPRFSLKQICKMKKDELKNKIFVIDENPRIRYVSIKKYTIQFGLEKHLIIQFIDISDQVMFNIANGEKKLLSLINATVSHEMRNPLNSIYSQNIKQNQINEKLREFIDSDLSQISTRRMKKVLDCLHEEQIESIKIQSSSTKILSFLVNDMLDFGQMRSGKFRKDIQNFNVKEAIQDIVNIQSMKAEFCGINLAYVTQNFDRNDHVICTDLQRVQQILLNLQSNALKFTPEGGSVIITCTLVKNESDLLCNEHLEYFRNSKGFGMIQVSVKDSGVGIRKEDQDKLFKLFGFLDNTKELNSKGVGLGLHISQKIAEELGGKIVLDSEYGHGADFIFVIDLEKKTNRDVQIKRVQNPVKKQYPKIIINRGNFVTRDDISVIQPKQQADQDSEKTVNLSEVYCEGVPIQPDVISFCDTQSENTAKYSGQIVPLTDLRKPMNTMMNFNIQKQDTINNSQEIISIDKSCGSDDSVVLANQGLLGKFKTQLQISQKQTLPKRILIVDDEPYNFIGLKIILEAADPGDKISDLIDKANNGQQALKTIQKAHFDGQYQYGLIFMDCSMPIMDGYEATDKIRKYQRINFLQQPMIVACTGHSENEYIKKAWRHQMDEVIPKPANIEVIRVLLREIVQYQD